MHTSFTPGDRVSVTTGRYVGRTGTVSYLSMGMVWTDMPGGDKLAFYPDELALDLQSEGSSALADLLAIVRAVAA